MAKIKTRDAVKGTIKAINKAAVASERMKAAYAKTKEKAEQGYYAEESSATEYAADKVSHASERIAGEGVHQFNKQGQKSVQTTKENIIKAKDKVADFKEKGRQKPQRDRKHSLLQNGTAHSPITGRRAVPLPPIPLQTQAKKQRAILSRQDSRESRPSRPPPEMPKRR